ncbi:hypothetical protein [Rathayibacter soli]|uniref:hypothetical protein n=1 Tax=Rathayibacter soli TaxID=3144168 RepID=UPI0027E40131|nr:hypothetical protein [Glaciibacter superstes]
MTETHGILIAVPADNTVAIQRLRAELRAARHRRADERRVAMFATVRALPFGGVNANGS